MMCLLCPPWINMTENQVAQLMRQSQILLFNESSRAILPETRTIEFFFVRVPALDVVHSPFPARPRHPTTVRQLAVCEIENPPRPIEIEAPPRPIEIEAPPRPIEIEAPPRPIEIEAPPRPIEKEAPPRPIEIEAPRRPIEIEAPPRPNLRSEIGELVRRPKKARVPRWLSLPYDIQENILQRVEFRDLFRFKTLSKACKKLVESDDFSKARGAISASEGLFTTINYYIKHNSWQCSGYDLHSKSWRALPTFSCLPPPDAELFKEYSVCGHGGLMCADVSKLPKKGELVVFNPLTGKKKALPPLLYPRNPVLVHISVNSAKKSYKVIVAGSSAASDEHLSKKMEVFDSSTSQWKETCDLPGPAFGLNEHQAGVCLNGKLYFISFLECDGGKGVVSFDMEHEKWLENLVCPIPFSSYSNTLQLVESDGKVCLFSEQERGQSVEHCIDVLERANPNAGPESWQWKNVVRVRKSGGRGLLVYPEHTCVGFGEGKLCIFNALNRDGVVYDMQNGRQLEILEPSPAGQKGDNFFSLNPASFTLEPSFHSDPNFPVPQSIDKI